MSSEPGWLLQRQAGHAVIEKLIELHQARVGFVPGQPPTSRISAEMLPWYLGAQGEIAVGNMLATLPPPWFVLHAVPVGTGSADIDHLVVGPAGVFTINSKHHPGKNVVQYGDRAIYVGGPRQQHLVKARAEARLAAKLLSAAARSDVPVQPVVAVLGRSVSVKAPGMVTVLQAQQLTRWLWQQPQRLAPEELEAIRIAAGRPATWGAPSMQPGWDGAAVRAWFIQFEQVSRTARLAPHSVNRQAARVARWSVRPLRRRLPWATWSKALGRLAVWVGVALVFVGLVEAARIGIAG